MDRRNRDILCVMGYEDAVVFENPDYDNAIIGVTTDGQVVYDYDEMIVHLMEVDGMDEADAVDFIDYNTLRSLPYTDGAPIVIYKIG